MTHWRRLLVAGVGALSLVGAGTVSAAADEGGGTLIEFDSMTPVTGTAVGTVNDRGIRGGGLPWAITSGSGEVDRRGNVEIEVTGLVIPPLNGTNPVPFFSATVSCLTPGGVVNVTTGLFPATRPGGNSTIDAHVNLPQPCNSPEVFVGTTTTTGVFLWFARSNPEDEVDN